MPLFRWSALPRPGGVLLAVALLAGLVVFPRPAAGAPPEPPKLRPVIGEWHRIAGNPDLGEWTSEQQEPVDFGVWQAADGTWQLWSCIRNTKRPGRTRIFHRWEGASLDAADWAPKGVTFIGDGTIGETVGGMQAPYTIRDEDGYHLFYGEWRHICRADGRDGKTFEKLVDDRGMVGLFGEGPGGQARDPMLIKVGARWLCYYCAHPGGRDSGTHGVWMRSTTDLVNFSESRRVCYDPGAGSDWFNMECPHVVRVGGYFYLFSTQTYARGKQNTRVYRSADPTYFGLSEEEAAEHFVCELPVAAPELIHHEGEWSIAALSEQLDGIRLAPLSWEPDEESRP